MKAIATEELPWTLVTRKNRTGRIHRKLLHEGTAGPGIGYTADLVRYEGGYGTFTAPRHRHNFDQIRFAVSGQPDFGHEHVMGEGQSAFFPAGAYYGPETIEEADLLLIQWGRDWITREQHDATHAEMATVGQFQDGFYMTVDAQGNEHRSDGRNAVWEAFHHRKLEYPTPRYPHPVIMQPEAFDWRQLAGGLFEKSLGRFTEDGVYISHYRLEPGGVLRLTADRTQLLWVIAGEIDQEGQRYEAATAIFSDFGEATEVTAREMAESVVFGLPLSPVG